MNDLQIILQYHTYAFLKMWNWCFFMAKRKHMFPNIFISKEGFSQHFALPHPFLELLSHAQHLFSPPQANDENCLFTNGNTLLYYYV